MLGRSRCNERNLENGHLAVSSCWCSPARTSAGDALKGSTPCAPKGREYQRGQIGGSGDDEIVGMDAKTTLQIGGVGFWAGRGRDERKYQVPDAGNRGNAARRMPQNGHTRGASRRAATSLHRGIHAPNVVMGSKIRNVLWLPETRLAKWNLLSIVVR